METWHCVSQSLCEPWLEHMSDLEHILWRRAGRRSKFPSTVSTLSSVISGRGVIGPLSSRATCTVLSSLALRMSVSMRHVYQVLQLR